MRPAALVALALVTACRVKGPELPVFKTVPPFQLTADTGARFDSAAQLAGKVWIADFIFTTCMGPCPRLSSQMKNVQAALAGLENVRLVSFTVDPDNDTPEALAAYAKRYSAKPGRWFFLTGSKETLNNLSLDAFMLSKVDGQMDHSTRIVLVDKRGRIRKYYGTSEEFSIPALIVDVKALLKEPV